MTKKVLIVEDDAILSHALREALVGQYRVRIAESGEDALVCIAEDLPDFILLELMMPDMNGIEILREFHKNPQHTKVNIAILTNANNTEMLTSATEKHTYHHFIKGDTSLRDIAKHVRDTLRE